MAFDLKQEGDVKEYVDKLGVEYRFGCYNEKKPEGKMLRCDVVFILLQTVDCGDKKYIKINQNNCVILSTLPQFVTCSPTT